MSLSLKERLPEVLPLFRDSRLATVIEAIQSEFDEFKSDTEDVQDSLFVQTADGGSLDQIGADFGLIGRRRGRDDTAYRQFLQSIVPAFDGRGTERDVEVAVGAGVARAPRFVDLRQDFSNREYEVELFDWAAHRSGTVHDLADLADPVAVDRVDPVYLFSDKIAVGVDAAATESGIETVAETQPVTITADAATAETVAVGLSSNDIEGLGTTRKLSARSVSLRATGRLAAVETVDADTVGVQFDSSFTVGLELVIKDGETSFVTDSFTTDSLDIDRRVPEAKRVALRLTSTAPGAGSVLLGSADAVSDPERLSTANI
jgi:hypothetical protein